MLSFLKGSSGISGKYSIGQEAFRAGPWSVRDGKSRSTQEPVSVFVFEKASLHKLLPQGVRKSQATQTVVDHAQSGVAQLSKLRHPSFVRLIEPLETGSKTLMFVTERLSSSLETLVTQRRNDSPGAEELNDLAIERGALVLCEGLQFLHELGNAHGNLCPKNVLVAANGDWKIAGLEFAAEFSDDFFPPSIDPRLPEYLKLDYNFMAPELALEHRLCAESDVWSLGAILYVSYTLKEPLDCRHDPNSYREEYDKFARRLRTQPPLAPRLSSQLMMSLFERMPSNRLELRAFAATDYFNHSLVKALHFLDDFETKSDSDKLEFLKYLEEILPQFPKSIVRRKILAFTVKELGGPQTESGECTYQLAKILFVVCANLSQLTFAEDILPLFKKLKANEQFHSALADNIETIVHATTEKTFAKEVLPILQIILKAKESDEAAQRSLLTNSAKFVPHLSLSTMEQKVFPLVIELFGATPVKSIKVAAIGSFGVMAANSLSTLLINDKLVPALQTMKTRDPAVVMAAKDLYNVLAEKMPSAAVIEKILPQLADLSLSRDLSVSQFRAIVASMRSQLDKFETEQVKLLNTTTEGNNTFNKQELSSSAAATPSFMETFPMREKPKPNEASMIDFMDEPARAPVSAPKAQPKPVAPIQPKAWTPAPIPKLEPMSPRSPTQPSAQTSSWSQPSSQTNWTQPSPQFSQFSQFSQPVSMQPSTPSQPLTPLIPQTHSPMAFTSPATANPKATTVDTSNAWQPLQPLQPTKRSQN